MINISPNTNFERNMTDVDFELKLVAIQDIHSTKQILD